MTTELRLEEICDRGFKDAESLSFEERFVYLLADLETLIDMEGWDHFFMTERLRYYHDLVSGLQAAGDSASVEILQDYERHFGRYGVAFEPTAIAHFLSEEPAGYIGFCRDWQSEFEFAKETRWNKVEANLYCRGYKIVG